VIEKILQRLPSWLKSPAAIVFSAAEAFGRDRVGRMAAAVSYRTVFALAPLLIIAVSIAGLVLGGSEQATQQLLTTVESVAGPEVSSVLADLIKSAAETANSAAVLGGVLLLWTASSLFLEVQMDLNDIFEVPQEKVSGVWATIRKRGLAFVWALGLGLLVLVVLLMNGLWRFLGDLLPPDLSTLATVISYLTPLVSVLLLPMVFALIFQTMTAIRVPWRAIWTGGLFTSVVFVAAAYLIGLYFDIAGAPSAVGFATSFVVVIFLAYLLSTVFLFGAEVTKVHAEMIRDGGVNSNRRDDDDPLVLVSAPPDSLPRTALLAFLAGVFIGWRRKR
jgi:membrane protein